MGIDEYQEMLAVLVPQESRGSATVRPASRSIPRNEGYDGAGVAPILIQGEPVGVLGVYQDPEQPLSSEEFGLVQSVSDQVAAALESARLAEETRAALSESRILYRFSELVSGETDLRAVYDAVARALVEELGYASSWIARLDRNANALNEVARAGHTLRGTGGRCTRQDGRST